MTEIDVFGNVIPQKQVLTEDVKPKKVLTETVEAAPEKEVLEETVQAPKKGRKKKLEE